MISQFGRAALALDLLPLGVCKWDLVALLEAPDELEVVSQERLDQLLYASPSARGKHVSLAERDCVLEKADTEIAELNSLGASLITMFDGPETYPGRLLECYRPPIFLQILGDATVLLRDCIAIVGSRKPTPEGIRAASDFAGQLAAAGLVVVSGLAYGIDKAAHVGCLDAGGQTIAVLGSSIDEIYPTIHVPIARSIARNGGGAVISEFHLHMQPTVYTFPQRNRVISGLSLGVLVVEAAKESGSLLTANFALEQNREVFAIPGSIYALQHVGTNALIKSGAKLVQSVRDVLDELPGFKAAPEELPSEVLSQQEQSIVGCIQAGCTSVDLLCERLACAAPQVLSVLTSLELRGLLVRRGPDSFAIVQPL
ncbi:DNA-processing protein DprA [Candidatus Cryosericum terrychapinii]|uniref:DNA-protecting protein DprA n=1 Tax=Candidatus Cryosericum terrychapinii TaxID=2290919 RepID=A0A398D0G2_9BACT|nr:DNA-processing protein DprA [Candidatus Cryosericum terrychapinii]RIE06218.1 DNA-protecting protein DprA [Candidatus Cryosericum terrychapinii]